MYVGQQFEELINQGMRDCVVIASTGTKFLYEYEMPNGSSAIRNQDGKSISYKSISKFWLSEIEHEFGLDNLLASPQGHNRTMRGNTLIGILKQKLAPSEDGK